MDISIITEWMKTSVTGIIILGALGSLAALLLIKIVNAIISILPQPLRSHKIKRLRHYFTLGATSRIIEEDNTGNSAVVMIAYRISRLLISLTVLILSIIIFSISITISTEISISIGLFILTVIGFLAFYSAYFEYLFIKHTYRTKFSSAEDSAKEFFISKDKNA